VVPDCARRRWCDLLLQDYNITTVRLHDVLQYFCNTTAHSAASHTSVAMTVLAFAESGGLGEERGAAPPPSKSLRWPSASASRSAGVWGMVIGWWVGAHAGVWMMGVHDGVNVKAHIRAEGGERSGVPRRRRLRVWYGRLSPLAAPLGGRAGHGD
jgi:hypothetical protein